MKKLFIALSILVIAATGCQKRAVCTYLSSGVKIRLYSGDFNSPTAYSQAVAGLEANGYWCEQKDESILTK